MFPVKYPIPQSEPPKSPREILPTMYDLPSENPEEPGLPDEFHDLQPQLLSLTFRPPHYPALQVFSGSDLNLYYDLRHPQWYKRPDWFGVVGVPRLYDQVEMRLSYVVWQEAVNPFVIVELLSPGTEKEDLDDDQSNKLPVNGQVVHVQTVDKPPRKWDVYEQILRIPYYIVFSRYTDELRVFNLVGGHYQELDLSEPRVWMPELELGLGLWQGEYQGIERLWLRWYDHQGDWIPTETEQERQRAEQAEARIIEEQQRAQQAEARIIEEQQRAQQAEARIIEEQQRAQQAEARIIEEQQRAQQAEARIIEEQQRAQQAEARLNFLMQQLRESGIDPDTFFPR